MRPSPFTSLGVAFAAVLAASAPALAEPQFASTAELLDAVRSNRVREGTLVTLTRARLTTEPVNADSGPNEYTTWFYVNDRGRDGDGVLVALPNYYTSGSDPFDEDSEDPYESEIDIPTLHRGYEVKVSGLISSRSDGQGYVLERPLDWDHLETFIDLVVSGTGDDETHSMVTKIGVLSTTTAPTPARPSNIRVVPGTDLQPRDLLVITGRDLGDRAKLLWDGRALEVLSRRPGALTAAVPATAQAGEHLIRVSNPESGPSPGVRVRVVASAPASPLLKRVERAGSVLVLAGERLRSTAGGTLEVLVGTRKLSIIHADERTVIVEAPAGLSGSVKVRLAGRDSNALAIPAATTGLTGAVPGQ